MKVLIDGQTLSTPEIQRGIGVVFKQICEGLIVNDISKEWFITVRNLADLRYLSLSVQKRLTPLLVDESLNQEGHLKQTEHYSQTLSRIVDELDIDAYWNPNPLMMNVVLPTALSNTVIFATIYDLIPIILPQDYLEKWAPYLQEEYRRRLEILPSWADRLIFISESAKKDFERIDPRTVGKSIAIPLAVDHTKFWSHSSQKKPSKNSYILFTGGFDPRKNMVKALEAFSYLVRGTRKYENLKFYVVCHYDDEARQKYERLAAKLGVKDRLVLTGYVDDEQLVTLYREASVFFFPSKYEGFGLPVLEALACGLPIVTTEVASIPEVVGNLAYYCSVDNPKEMAIALEKALTEDNRMQESVRRARKFSWSKTVASYSKLFTHVLFEVQNSLRSRHKKIAFVSPWVPQRSGIARYSYEVVRHLKAHVDITLYLDGEIELIKDNLGLTVKSLLQLPEEIKNYDCVVYHIGNNTSFHKEIYKMAWQYPGVVVLHEFNIHPFLADAFLGTKDEYLYADALEEGYGDLGRASYQSLKLGGTPEIWKFPMSSALVERSAATIVHSHWAKEQLKELNPKVFVIPMGGIDRENGAQSYMQDSLRERFKISANHFMISTFGFVNSLKRIPKILEAVRILINKGYPIKFFIGGDLIEPSLRLEKQIESLNLSEHVIISGYLHDDDFANCLRMSDVVLNLRCPSMGESSAALTDALGYGKACLVSNYQQFAEFPDSVCWKVDVGELEVQQIVAYLQELMCNSEARKQLSKNAEFFVKSYASYQVVGELYAYVIGQMEAKPL